MDILATIQSVVKSVNDVLWGPPMLLLLFGTHIFLTIRTGFIQRKTFQAINANFPRSVILNRVFGFTKLGFPYKINVFRTFLLKMCGFFAILIE